MSKQEVPITTADYDMDEYFKDDIDRFTQLDKQSQSLYDSFKPVVENSLIRVKNSLSPTGGLRELSEGISALSKLNSDSMSAISHRVHTKNTIQSIKFKKLKDANDSQQEGDITSLMRQITATLTADKANNNQQHTHIHVPVSQDIDGVAKLKERLANDLASGKIVINSNEKAMKYDFDSGKIRFAYNRSTGDTVAVNRNGELITDYPTERIPEGQRFNRIEDGNPINKSGSQMTLYQG